MDWNWGSFNANPNWAFGLPEMESALGFKISAADPVCWRLCSHIHIAWCIVGIHGSMTPTLHSCQRTSPSK